jgi:hypothetical protein
MFQYITDEANYREDLRMSVALVIKLIVRKVYGVSLSPNHPIREARSL